jgi:adenine phosphoribosyltransferase
MNILDRSALLTLPLAKEREDWLKSTVRDVVDYPKPGIVFKDLTTLMRDAEAFSFVLDALANTARKVQPTVVVGIEARGFILAPVVAHQLGLGFVPVRKPGKLPWEVEKQAYALEYGEDTIEVHKDSFNPGDRVLIVDDLLATGGTAKAAKSLVEKLGATVVGAGFVIELAFLDGREQLGLDDNVFSVIRY